MMQPALLVFATRYDDVTRRTHGIAQRLLASAGQCGIATSALLETAALGPGLMEGIASHPVVIAFYCHGDGQGRLLAQDRQPCWTGDTIPDLSGIAVFAHACRAIRWLTDQAARHRARLMIGYEGDLITPADGSIRFWDMYGEVHSFVAQHLAAGTDDSWIRREFYEVCTRCFHELDKHQAGLIELVAIQQSRDEVVFA